MFAAPDPTTDTGRLSRFCLFVLRNSAGPLFLLILAGSALLVVGSMKSGRKPRADEFAIVTARGSVFVERLELPPGWTADYQPTKNHVQVGISAPDTVLAFRVSLVATEEYDRDANRVRKYGTADEFAGVWTAKGATVERKALDGAEVAVARQDAQTRFPAAWGVLSDDRVTRLTYFAAGRAWCLQFDIPPARLARFEPTAELLFRKATTLPKDDPRADHLIVDESAMWWRVTLRTAGGWLLGVCVPMLVVLPWLGLAFQVRLAAERALRVRAVDQPESPKTGKEGEDELAKAVAGFTALGFECAGWYSLGDFEGTVLGTWQHLEHRARGFILYYPGAGVVRVRFARRFDSGAILVSSTRFVDHSYDLPAGLFLQRMKACVAELWEWHRTAEGLFPTQRGEPELPVLSPLDRHLAFRQRIAKFHRTYLLWSARYELLCELTRSLRLSGKSLQQQVERGWTPDPALYQGDGDEDAKPEQ